VAIQCTPWFGLTGFVSSLQSISARQGNPTHLNAKFMEKTSSYIGVNLVLKTTVASQFMLNFNV
jgi:hypothetical protein